jgi:hypothetical protein
MARTGPGQWLAEGVATFGLLLTILGCNARTPAAIPYAVGLYIASAYWFTASNVVCQSGRDRDSEREKSPKMTSVYNLLRESCGLSTQSEAAEFVHEVRLDTV